MLELSKKQKKIYEKMLSEPERVWVVEDFSSLIFGSAPPKHWRAYLLMQMRWVCAKTQSYPEPVVRTSSNGRGNVAKFAFLGVCLK
jgi:hypothetical protein